MRSFLKSMASVVLASCFSVSGLTASAQTITPNTAPQCLPTTSNTDALAVTYTFSPGALNTPLLFNWKAEGDIAFDATSPTVANNTTSPVTLGNVVKIKSTGYGKGRLTAEYYYNQGTGNGSVTCNNNVCPFTYALRVYGKVSVDIFKSFPASATTIAGPLCLAPNTSSVVYSVFPIISSLPMLQSSVGVDLYTWSVNYVAGGTLIGPVTYQYASGDQSAITISPAPTQAFTVDVRVGQCNGFKGVGNGQLTLLWQFR